MPDSSDALARFRFPVAFTADTRLHEIDTPLGPDALIVERFIGQEALSTLLVFHVDCLSTDTHLELKRLLDAGDGATGGQGSFFASMASGCDGASGRICCPL